MFPIVTWPGGAVTTPRRPNRRHAHETADRRRRFVRRHAHDPKRAAFVRPDLLLLNAALRTMDPTQPTADAIALAGSRIVAVGATATCAAGGTQDTGD